KPVRRLTAPATAGIRRITWDLRHAGTAGGPPRAGGAGGADDEGGGFGGGTPGPLVIPGRFQVSLAKRVAGKLMPLAGPVAFNVAPEGSASLTVADRKSREEFQKKLGRLQNTASATQSTATTVLDRLTTIHRALDDYPAAPAGLRDKARELELQVQ